jgi:hypothetical protein
MPRRRPTACAPTNTPPAPRAPQVRPCLDFGWFVGRRMSEIDIASLGFGELELLLQSALNPAVPVEVLYATLDRLSASADWRNGTPISQDALAPADMTSTWSVSHPADGSRACPE